jgi:hypothetical protein
MPVEAHPNEPIDTTPYPITSVCRADLAQVIDPHVVARFTDDDMLTLADKMADAYTDSGLFWTSLEIIAENILERKARQEENGLA